MNKQLLEKIHKIYKNNIENLPNNHSRDTMCKMGKYQNIIDLSEKALNLYNELDEISYLGTDGKEMQEMIQKESQEIKTKMTDYITKMENLLTTEDTITSQNVIMEVRAGTGGDEASIFASDLVKMYSRYGETQKWKVEYINSSENDTGIKSAVILIKGKNVYTQLKNESGVHRVQRIPETESSGRIHTSTASISILPEQDSNINININNNDLQIDTYRASGAGGQHVNKTDSAVRITHSPSGIIVQCQSERSQHENKKRCLKELEIKLYQQEKNRMETEVSSKKQQQIGRSMRNEKIRTYNFPQNRVTDHRYSITLYKLETIMIGQLDELLQMVCEQQKKQDLESIIGNI